MVAYIVLSITLGIGFVLFILPGVFLSVKWSVAFAAIVSERAGPFSAIGRSWELTRGHWWRTFGTLLVLGLLSLVLYLAIVAGLGSAIATNQDMSEVTYATLTVALTIVLFAILYPLIAAIISVMYYDLRVRNEGFDLQLLAQGVGADTSRFESAPELPGAPPSTSVPPPSTSGGFAPPEGPAPDAVSRLVALVVATLVLAVPTTAAADAQAASQQEGSPAADRQRAARDTRRPPLQRHQLPQPLKKPLQWLGDRLQPIADWINDRGAVVPGGPIALWMILAALVVVAAGSITGTTIRRRALAIERARAAALPEADDPHALERTADRAEQDGDFERAVRLRFRAGLLRLDRRHVLVYRPSLTTGEVARAIRAPAFAEVGARFDEIAYGGRPAQREDAEAAKRGWKDVLTQAEPR